MHSVWGSQRTIKSSYSHSLNYFLKSVRLLRELTLPSPLPHPCARFCLCVCRSLCSQSRFASARHCSPALPPAAGDRSALRLSSPLPQSPNQPGPPSISSSSMACLCISLTWVALECMLCCRKQRLLPYRYTIAIKIKKACVKFSSRYIVLLRCKVC